MSAIKKMNQELKQMLGRDPTIHEQVDVLILAVLKERVYELQLAFEMNPEENYKEAYHHALKCVAMIQKRNPDIFTYNDSEGGGDDHI
tara:strand:- start:75 stop:338 length:264 start_codon:yes stop_codon:yes gene_type:complete